MTRNSAPRQQRSGGRRHKGGGNERRKMRLFNVTPVQFRTNFLKHDYDAQELMLRVGDDVIVETTRGPAIARVTGHVQRQLLPEGSIQRVLRRATDSDISQAERNETREREGYLFALERIRVRKLPMKLIRAQYMHDGSKIVFYFSADGRIDFRDLVKDLAHRFRTRIEMHQIGVRDGARMLGGIGPCGRELCCSTFLENFAPVSIRMAKDQGLTLNPKKVSGMCGRLMCCLVYEQQIYKNMRRRIPRIGAEVYTEAGKARVIGVDVINAQVTVELEDTNRRTFPAVEVSDEEPTANQTVEASDEGERSEYLWDDINRPRGAASSSESDEDKPKRRRRRRRRKKKPVQGDAKAAPDSGASDAPRGQEGAKNSGQSASEQEGGEPKKRGRRRRRRRKKKGGGEGGSPSGD